MYLVLSKHNHKKKLNKIGHITCMYENGIQKR